MACASSRRGYRRQLVILDQQEPVASGAWQHACLEQVERSTDQSIGCDDGVGARITSAPPEAVVKLEDR